MDGLFSHAPEPGRQPGTHPLPPETWVIEIPADIVQAAEGFLDYLHLWWPLAEFSVGGAGGQLWWDSERLVEDSADGEQIVWGTTEVWDPPLTMSAELSLPGAENDRWVVSMQPHATSTTVEVRAPVPRRGTEADSKPPAEGFWGNILGFYGRFMGATESPTRIDH